jgi:hypothetical protein
MAFTLHRRAFGGLIGGLAAATTLPRPAAALPRRFGGPNVIIVRFGGGVRRFETIDRQGSYAPYLSQVLTPRGTLFPQMRISPQANVVTSHAQGTLYLLTGRYDVYRDVDGEFLRERFEPKSPTLFEYVRQAFGVPAHQTLIVNGEDRKDEDFLTYSTDRHYGVRYRSAVLSLNQFKTYLLKRQIAEGAFDGEALIAARTKLRQFEALDYRREAVGSVPELDAFWDRWRQQYGSTGFKNPRGDRLLTALALRALRELKPKLLLINYQDTDYVHWGNKSHYTRAISIIDEGLKQLAEAIEADETYRGNTVFIVVPDCGRDDNQLMAVPYQHHFGSPSAHDVWALLVGPRIAKGVVVDKTVEQIAVAPTVGALMGFKTDAGQGSPLAEAFV